MSNYFSNLEIYSHPEKKGLSRPTNKKVFKRPTKRSKISLSIKAKKKKKASTSPYSDTNIFEKQHYTGEWFKYFAKTKNSCTEKLIQPSRVLKVQKNIVTFK